MIQALLGTEDEEFIDFIGLILIKLKYGPWDQKKGSGRISLVYPRKRIEAMKNAANDSIGIINRAFVTRISLSVF